MGYKVSNACCVTYETYCSVLLSIVSGMQIFLISIFLSDCRFMRKTSLWLKDAAEGDDLWRLEYVRENLDPSCCSSLLTWTTSTSLTFGNMLSIESGCERIIPKERVRQVRRWRSQHMRTVSVNFAPSPPPHSSTSLWNSKQNSVLKLLLPELNFGDNVYSLCNPSQMDLYSLHYF